MDGSQTLSPQVAAVAWPRNGPARFIGFDDADSVSPREAFAPPSRWIGFEEGRPAASAGTPSEPAPSDASQPDVWSRLFTQHPDAPAPEEPSEIPSPVDLPESIPEASLATIAPATASPALRRGIKLAALAILLTGAVGALRLDQTGDERGAPAAAAKGPPPASAAAPSAAAASASAASGSAASEDSLERAADYLERARAGDHMAQYQLGMLYARGERRSQDLPRAASWFAKAAAAGISDAQYNLATLYERALGVPQDLNEALKWYKAAADQDHPLAEHNLAVAYVQGRGTPQNFDLAADLFRRSAEQGCVPAMVNLAIMYQKGKGVAASLADSYAWYRAAGQRGDAEAEGKAAALLHQFAPGDQPVAEAIAVAVAERIHNSDQVPLPVRSALAENSSGPVLQSGLQRPAESAPIGTAALIASDPAEAGRRAPLRPRRPVASGPTVGLKQPDINW